MHVGLVLAGDPDAVSGGFYYDRRLCERLRDRGHRVSVVSLSRRSYPRHLLDNLRRLRGRLRGFDVVLEDGICHPSLLAANRRLDVPTVALVHMLWTVRSSGFRSPVVRAVERGFLRGVDAAIYTSEATRTEATRLGGPSENVVVRPGGDRFVSGTAQSRVMDGADTEVLDEDVTATVTEAELRARAGAGLLEITYLGNVVRRKGLDVLIDALGAMISDWRLVVVGDRGIEPDYAATVDRQILRGGLSDRVRFAGRLADDAVAERLRRTDVLAVPSRYEPFGIASLEGMSFGCVPLATTNGGPPEFVDDGETGILVDPGAAETITTRLDALAADRDLLADRRVAARRAFDRQPTWTEQLDRAVGFLEAQCPSV